MKHYVSVKSMLQHPPCNTRAFDVFENAVSKCPVAVKGLNARQSQDFPEFLQNLFF